MYLPYPARIIVRASKNTCRHDAKLLIADIIQKLDMEIMVRIKSSMAKRFYLRQLVINI